MSDEKTVANSGRTPPRGPGEKPIYETSEAPAPVADAPIINSDEE